MRFAKRWLQRRHLARELPPNYSDAVISVTDPRQSDMLAFLLLGLGASIICVGLAVDTTMTHRQYMDARSTTLRDVLEREVEDRRAYPSR